MNQYINPGGFSGPSTISNISTVPVGVPTGRNIQVTPFNLDLVTFQSEPLSRDVPPPEGAIGDCPLPEKRKVIQMKVKPEDRTIAITREEARNLNRTFQERMADLPVGEFYGMSFTIFNEEEIRNTAAVIVTSSDLEGPDTVNDPRFCVISGNQACSECTNTLSNCPGHIGYIELNSPYSPEIYQKFAVQVLNSICLGCKHILLDEEVLGREGFWYWSGEVGDPGRRKIWRYYHEERLRRISELTKRISPKCTRYLHDESKPDPCPPNPKYKREQKRIKYRYNKNDQWTPIFLEQVKKIFEYIPQEDSVLLGFDPSVHPKRLMLKYLPVLPLCNRPTRPSNGPAEQDDLTKMYRKIVVANKKVNKLQFVDRSIANRSSFPELLVSPTPEQTGLITKLQNEIGKLIFGPKTKEEHSKSIKKLLQGKKGLPRNEMMGTRGDYSARTVISPGPELEFGEIGVPKSWASTLTYPVFVTSENRDALTELMAAGKVSKVHLKRKEGHQITITPNNKTTWVLEVGDTVERHMQDGDYTTINRNPSLHKYSILGYKVKLMEGLTIRMNIGNTPGHNADFDGDEINLFNPRSAEAIAELQTVMNARFCIINVQDNQPLTGLVFNDLTAAYKLTQDDVVVRDKTWEDSMRIIAQSGNSTQLVLDEFGRDLRARLKRFGIKWKSGKALFSALLPEDLYYESGDVRIVQGILVQGSISKNQAGTSHRSIAQFIFKNYNLEEDNYYAGAERAAKFLTDAQFVLKRWLEDEPITTSLADCYPRRDLEGKVNQIYAITHSPDKLALMDWNLCREILERHSRYVDFDSLYERLKKHPIEGVELPTSEGELPKSGYILISSILPKNLNLEIEGQNVILEGILVKKIETKDYATKLRKAILVELNGSIKYKSDRAIQFIVDIKTILVRCLDISPKTGEHYELLRRNIEKAKSIMEIYGPKLTDPIEGKKAKEFLITQLNSINNIGETIIEKNLDPNNNFVLIVNGAKTKGTPVNIGQIIGTLGPQFKGTELLSEGNNIYQTKGDWDPVGYGVVQSNFRDGLRPAEFFHHMMASRVGLVDTSIKTAEPGALSRQIVKNTEGILVQRDRTVKLQERFIVQSVYGYTGLNPERMINVTFPEGEIPFFIDIESVARRINGSYGYYS
uniref:DNA-directed RNA polymerase subunit n=1 Tax=Pithovirus LCPAC201 TaxID=2506591 RepID=A0A481Z556_9VIRU|nr:MAG: DNA-directed RNA polymerase subunit alpha [Pithovirus LCPAC201]